MDGCIRDSDLDLPMLAQAVTEIVEMCNAKETNATQISKVLHGDQSLAGHVLRVSNSPLYRPRTPITSLQQAVTRLGLAQIIEIALAVSLRARVFTSERYMDVVKGLWKCSVATGCFSKEIARLQRHHVESTFLCGLFHNVGKPVVLDALSKLEETNGRDLPMETVELALEEYHVRAGGKLVREWNLPPQVAEAVQYHQDYRDAPLFRQVAMTVNLAIELANIVIEKDDELWPQCSEGVSGSEVCGDLGLTAANVKTLMSHAERVRETVRSMV
jgi:HD-like signal output (HDOD) protein